MIRKGPSPTSNFTVLSNELLRDNSLTWEARGLLAYLLSQSESWEVSVKHLVNQSPKASRDKVYRIINELVEAGYILRLEVRGRNGQIVGTDYEVYPSPAAPASTASGKAVNGFAAHGEHGCIRSTIPKEELCTRSTNNHMIISFAEVWQSYPRKIAKAAAEKAFAARLKEGIDPQLLAEATENYALACKGKESRYILHGSTFYGPDERWKDYLTGGAGMVKSPSKPMSVLAEFAEGDQ